MTLRATRGYDAHVPPKLPLTSQRLVVVTGKGGAGKTTVAAAAPGLPELLALQRIRGWVDARRLGHPVHDLVLVDAPASGHSLPLLGAPRTLGALARIGPVADLLGQIERLLVDHGRTLVCVVTTPEELAIRETIELHREIASLGLAVSPPIVNALLPRRFTAADAEALDRLEDACGPHPYLRAARFQLERRRHAEGQVAVLRRALGLNPVRLPFLFAPADAAGVAELAAELAASTGLAA